MGEADRRSCACLRRYAADLGRCSGGCMSVTTILSFYTRVYVPLCAVPFVGMSGGESMEVVSLQLGVFPIILQSLLIMCVMSSNHPSLARSSSHGGCCYVIQLKFDIRTRYF